MSETIDPTHVDRRPTRTLMVVHGAVVMAALAYLCQGAWPGVAFLIMIAGALLPVAGIVSWLLRQALPVDVRVPLGLAAAVLCATPWFYLRRALPLPASVADVVMMVLLTGAALLSGSYRLWLAEARAQLRGGAGLVMFVVLPFVFCLVWAGFAVRQGDVVRYYGLFPIDFSNLTADVALVRTSPGLPQSFIEGTGPRVYHWFYFAFPAWLSEFCGMTMRNGTALVLCNLLVAWLLFACLCAAATRAAPSGASRRVSVWAAAIVTLAPWITYFVQAALAVARVAPSERNRLLLSVINSMISFGNNTFALTLGLLAAVAFVHWRRTGRAREAAIAWLMVTATVGYSVTLFFPLALGAGAWWLVTGGLRRITSCAVAVAVVGGGLGVMYLTNILAESPRMIRVGFDNGAFALNVAASMLPLWFLAALGRVSWRRSSLEWTLVGACIVAPSLLYVEGSPTGQSDFSMKTASLLAVLLVGPVASGMARITGASGRPARWWMRVAAAVLVAMGLTNTAAYVGQFAFYRATGRHARSIATSADYDAAMEFVRTRTALGAIVIDPVSLNFRELVSTTTLGERRAWLPTPYTTELFYNNQDRTGPILERRAQWQAWRASGYSDATLGHELARSADYLVAPAEARPDADDWSPAWESRSLRIYRSNRRPAAPAVWTDSRPQL
ncbi:MAG: hypothetical protein ACREIT_00320 [Tepidisphaeraceae bacterium]